MACRGVSTQFVSLNNNLTTVTYNVELADGSKKQIIPPVFSDESNNEKKLIQVIDDIILRLGLFSSKKIDFDDFDNVLCKSEDLIEEVIEGSASIYRVPFNLLTYHKKNKWKMQCFNIAFRTLYNLIPNNIGMTGLMSYHDLPKNIKFERNGDIIDGELYNHESIKIHKSKSRNDETEQFYVRVNFIDDNSESCFKDVNLLNILKYTPEIRDINFFFKFIEEEKFEEKTEEYENVKFYNMLQSRWILDVLMPTIDNYTNFNQLNNNFNVRYF